MESIYLFCKTASSKNPKIRPKICQKYVTNVAYMLKIISLTGTLHSLEFFRKCLECFRDIDFFVKTVKNKDNFCNKENYFVADPAGYLVFMPNFYSINFFVSKREPYPEP